MREAKTSLSSLPSEPSVTSDLTVTPLSKKALGFLGETCVTDTCPSLECCSTYERRSPAGSSRPGSAKPVHTGTHGPSNHMETTATLKPAIHTRPRNTGSYSLSEPSPTISTVSSNHAADGPHRSPSKGNKPAAPRSAGTQRSNIPRSERVSGTGQKERLSEREAEKRTEREKEKRTRSEGERENEREKEKCTGVEREKTKRKQVDKEKEKRRESVHSKHHAASVIQRAWRRYSCLFILLLLSPHNSS